MTLIHSFFCVFAEMEDNEKESHTGLGPWNPQKTVAHLYKLQDLKQISQEKQGAEEMEGYLERLPPGKKKSTIWNSWKRQYFVAKAGLLLIFGDSSRSVLMDRIELHGGRVDYMETTMLGIQDRRGHYVVLRFKVIQNFLSLFVRRTFFKVWVRCGHSN